MISSNVQMLSQITKRSTLFYCCRRSTQNVPEREFIRTVRDGEAYADSIFLSQDKGHVQLDSSRNTYTIDTSLPQHLIQNNIIKTILVTFLYHTYQFCVIY